MKRLRPSAPFTAFFFHELRSVTRRSRFWLLLILLPLFAVVAAPRLIWSKIYLGFPCIIILTYLIPIVFFLPAWRKYQRSRFYDEVILTRLRSAEIMAGFFGSRVLIATAFFATAYGSTSLIGDNFTDRFSPTTYVCWSSGQSGPALISREVETYIDISKLAVWSNWHVSFAVFFFAFTIAYGAIVVGYLCGLHKSTLMVVLCLLLMTFIMDAAFYAISWSIAPYQPLYGDDFYGDATQTMIAIKWLVLHLSRAWLPWWYFLIKCAIGCKLIKLTARRLSGAEPTTAAL